MCTNSQGTRLLDHAQAEDEHVLLPLCNFEIVGMRREIMSATSSVSEEAEKIYCLNVLEIKLNLNLNALTLEQLRESRKSIAVDFARGLLQESEELMSGNELISKEQVAAKLLKIRDREPEHFNDIHNFREAINDLFNDWQNAMDDVGEQLKNHAQSLFDGANSSSNPTNQRRIEMASKQVRLVAAHQQRPAGLSSLSSPSPTLTSVYPMSRLFGFMNG